MNLHLLRDSNTWMRAGAAGVIALVAGLVGEWVAGGDGSTSDRQSTNLSGVTWDGALAADGTMTVEVRYQFLPAAFELDPDMPNALLVVPDGATRLRLNGRTVEAGTFAGVAPVATDDLVNTITYEVPDAARRVGDEVVIDQLVVSRLGWAQDNYGYADLEGTLRAPAGTTSSGTVHIPGARDVTIDHDNDSNDDGNGNGNGEGTIGFGGQVSTYDEAAVVAVLPAGAAPDVPEDGSADGRSATELFDQAVTERSPGRVPDGAPESGFRVNWRVVGLCVGIVVAMALSWMLGLFLRNRRRRT